MRLLRLAFAGMFAVTAMAMPAAAATDDFLTVQLKDGPVVIQLMPEVAPKHVAQVKALAAKGAYDNVVFHRVIKGFMAQTGDVKFGNSTTPDFNPSRAGTGGSQYPNLKQEFSAEPHVRGTASMARSQDPNSANSQFFICFGDARFLDRQYTVWGKVIEGMENVDQIKRGEPVINPDKMLTVKVAADIAA